MCIRDRSATRNSCQRERSSSCGSVASMVSVQDLSKSSLRCPQIRWKQRRAEMNGPLLRFHSQPFLPHRLRLSLIHISGKDVLRLAEPPAARVPQPGLSFQSSRRHLNTSRNGQKTYGRFLGTIYFWAFRAPLPLEAQGFGKAESPKNR